MIVKIGHEKNPGKIREGKIVLIKYMELQSRRFLLVNYRCDTYIRPRVNSYLITFSLKSLGPIDRKFHGHGENDGFVLYEYIIKQFSSFCKHTNFSDLKKKIVK